MDQDSFPTENSHGFFFLSRRSSSRPCGQRVVPRVVERAVQRIVQRIGCRVLAGRSKVPVRTVLAEPIYSGRVFAAVLVLLFTGAVPEGRALALSSPQAPSQELADYVVYARSELHWGGADVMPDFGALGADGAGITIDADTDFSADGTYVAAPRVVVMGQTRLAGLFANEVSLGPDVSVAGGGPQAFSAPVIPDSVYPRMPAFSCGTNDLTVTGGSGPVVLPPGSYGNIVVTDGHILELVPGGRYDICSLKMRADSILRLHEDNRIYLVDHLSTSHRVRFEGEGACAAMWFARGDVPSPAPTRAAFEFTSGGSANRSFIQGQFFTTARIFMAQHNDYVGRFWGGVVDAESTSRITRTLAACTATTCGDGILGGAEICDDGNNGDGDCCSAFCDLPSPGTPCDDGRFCNGEDVCDESGACVGSGDPCEGPDGDTNCSESCDEALDTCTGADPNGSPCRDENLCTAEGICGDGACLGQVPLNCDDGKLCTEDLCDPATGACTSRMAPALRCDQRGKGSLRLQRFVPDERGHVGGRLIAKWKGDLRGNATAAEEFGNPREGDRYALCVFDRSGGQSRLAHHLEIGPDSLTGDGSWRRRASNKTTSYTLKSRSGTAEGIVKMKMSRDRNGRVGLALEAGSNRTCPGCAPKFTPPTTARVDRFFEMDPDLSVQWVSSAGGCWAMDVEQSRMNEGHEFRAVAK